MKKFFLCLLFVLMLGTAGYVVVLGQRYTARKESASVDYSAAVGEMTGQFGQLVKNVDADTANQVLDFVRDKIDSGALDSREGLKDALQEGKEQFGVKSVKRMHRKLWIRWISLSSSVSLRTP